MKYPFKSRRIGKMVKQGERGVDYFLWREPGFDLQREISALSEDILEIGGPTPDGFYFLDNLELPSKPIMANLSKDKPYGLEDWNKKYAKYVDIVMDVRELPYADGSLGVMIYGGLTVFSDTIEVKSRKQGRELINQAYTELEEVAVGTLKPEDVKVSLRVQAGLQAYRALKPGGLLFVDGYLPELLVLERIGFKRRALLGINDDAPTLYYEMVLQK